MIEKLRRLREKIEENKCSSCPAYWHEYEIEDNDEGCHIHNEMGFKPCPHWYKPSWWIKLLMKRENAKEETVLRELLRELKAIPVRRLPS